MGCKPWHGHLPRTATGSPSTSAHGGGRQRRGIAGHLPPDGVPGDAPAPARAGGEEEEGQMQPRGRARALPGERRAPHPRGVLPAVTTVRPGAASPHMTGGEGPNRPCPAIPIARQVRVGARRGRAGGSASPGHAGKPWGCPLPAPTFGDGRPSRAAHPPRSLPSSCGAASPLPAAGQGARRVGRRIKLLRTQLCLLLFLSFGCSEPPWPLAG